ncbi:hypothetical protein D3C78_1654420 [compost metagenome]
MPVLELLDEGEEIARRAEEQGPALLSDLHDRLGFRAGKTLYAHAADGTLRLGIQHCRSQGRHRPH